MQLQNDSNEYTLEAEKYVRNIVSSHGVVVNNSFSLLWSGGDIVSWCTSLQIGEEISGQNINTKKTGTCLQNASKNTRKCWDMGHYLCYRGSVEGCIISQKRRGNYLWFWLQKVKYSECQIRDFLIKFASQRIERKEARGGFRINLKGFGIHKLKGG